MKIFYSMKHIFKLFFVGVLVINSCNPDNSETEISEKRNQQLINMYDNGIQPLHENFEAICLDFTNEVTDFSLNLNTSNLETVRAKWKTVAETYKRCEVYNVGDVQRSFIRFRIHRWETNVVQLEDTLATNPIITTEYISNLGSAIVGIAAIEYLIFENDATTTVSIFQNDANRLAYLVESANYLHQQAQALKTEWIDYSEEFKTATESRISGGQNLMTNALVAFIEETLKLRLGKALGDDNGGSLTIEEFEAFYSQHSLELIKKGFEEFKHIYRGDYINSDEFGFDDYLVFLDNETLPTTIEVAIENCENKLNDLQNLEDDLINNTAKVTALQTALQELLVLIKADMASYIGATIVPNDTDGD